MFSLKGKTALVTGGARGIGQSMAIGLAEAGADIILVVRDASQISTKSAIETLNQKCHLTTCDLSIHSQVQTLIPSLISTHKIDILVNCAGIQRRHPAAEFPDEVYEEIMQTNLRATFTLSRDIGKYWIENGIEGRIVNTASLATFQGGVRMAAYAASKGGVGMLTKALSNEWARYGIRVNAIAPGYVATDMNEDTRSSPESAEYLKSINERIPAGRWGKPDDFKGPVVFLTSAASSYVTGEILVVDGGWMAR